MKLKTLKRKIKLSKVDKEKLANDPTYVFMGEILKIAMTVKVNPKLERVSLDMESKWIYDAPDLEEKIHKLAVKIWNRAKKQVLQTNLKK